MSGTGSSATGIRRIGSGNRAADPTEPVPKAGKIREGASRRNAVGFVSPGGSKALTAGSAVSTAATGDCHRLREAEKRWITAWSYVGSVATQIDLYPGFPLPSSDYQPLLNALAADGAVTGRLRIAHSLGTLLALADSSDIRTVLLAPSVPGARPGRFVTRSALRLANSTPLREHLAMKLRRETYNRFMVAMPTGPLLSLRDAATRLSTDPNPRLPTLTKVVVICATGDKRNPAQLEMARALGADVHWVDGGHLFPISHPVATAPMIGTALPS
jgi:hypothetical protein